MHLNELKNLHISAVQQQAEELQVENAGRMRKQELMMAIIKKRAKAGEDVVADGVLEILPDGFGFLRSPEASFTASVDRARLNQGESVELTLESDDPTLFGKPDLKPLDEHFVVLASNQAAH